MMQEDAGVRKRVERREEKEILEKKLRDRRKLHVVCV
jgi:hypothetical protein